MVDQTTVNFLAKLSLACFLFAIVGLNHVDCRTLPDEERQYSGAPVATSSNGQVYQQYQQRQDSYQQDPAYQQYYDQQQDQSVQYQQQSFTSPVETSNNKSKRRSILSSIMAPFISMRDQGMQMLQASLSGCSPNSFSIWCSFWRMFIRR